MEKVQIEYEKLTGLDLLKIWSKDKDVLNNFLKETGLTEEVVLECIKNEDEFEILNEIIQYAEGCDLKFCYQCSCFVGTSAYINVAQQCVKCAIGNGI